MPASSTEAIGQASGARASWSNGSPDCFDVGRDGFLIVRGVRGVGKVECKCDSERLRKYVGLARRSRLAHSRARHDRAIAKERWPNRCSQSEKGKRKAIGIAALACTGGAFHVRDSLKPSAADKCACEGVRVMV